MWLLTKFGLFIIYRVFIAPNYLIILLINGPPFELIIYGKWRVITVALYIGLILEKK